MWRRVQLVVLGSAAVLSLGGAGALTFGWQGPAAASESSFERSPSAQGHDTCTLVVDVTSPHGRPAPIGRRGAGGEHGVGRPGNLSVSIPPVVFVRPQGRRLVVTTNTGARPQPSDNFYVVAGGRAELAGPAVRDEVLSACHSAEGGRPASEGGRRLPRGADAAPAPRHGRSSPKS